MILSTVQTAASVWVERYETLRRHVLCDTVLAAQPLSLVLWVAHGMAGWMDRLLVPNHPPANCFEEQLRSLSYINAIVYVPYIRFRMARFATALISNAAGPHFLVGLNRRQYGTLSRFCS